MRRRRPAVPLRSLVRESIGGMIVCAVRVAGRFLERDEARPAKLGNTRGSEGGLAGRIGRLAVRGEVRFPKRPV